MSRNQLRSPADQPRPSQDLAGNKAKDGPAVQKWQVAKRVTWSILLAGAFLAFYLMDRLNEALSILR